MQCSLRRTNNNIEKVVDGGSGTILEKSLGPNNSKFGSKDPEVLSACILRDPEQRYFIVTWLAPPWKIVLPLHGTDQRNQLASETHVKMDGLDPVSQLPAIPVPADLRRRLRNHPAGRMYSAKSNPSSSSGENIPGKSRNRGSVNKQTKAVTVSTSSCQQNSFLPSDSSGSACDSSNAANSADLIKDMSKGDKPVKRISRKKAKKKGKQYKKPSRCINSVPLEAASEGGIHGIDGPVGGDGHSLENNLYGNAMPSSTSLQEISMEKDGNEDIRNDIMNCSTTPTTCTSYSDEVDESENAASGLQDFISEPFNCSQLGVDDRPDYLIDTATEIRTTENSQSPFGGEVSNKLLKQNSNCGDISSHVLSVENSAPILDSFSDGWNSDHSTNGRDDVEMQSSIKKENGNNNTHDYSCTDRTKCCGEGCSSSGVRSCISSKRGRQGGKLAGTGSSTGVHRTSSGINMHSRSGKENNHSVWQKVQKNDTDECIREPKNVNPVCSPFDAALKEAPLSVRHDTFVGLRKNECEKSSRSACLDETSALTNPLKRVSNIFDSDVFLQKSEHDSSRNKAFEKLKRKSSIKSNQENNYYIRKGLHTDKTNSIHPTKTNERQKDSLQISTHLSYQKSLDAGSRSPCDADSQGARVALIECCPLEPLQNSEIHLDETKLLESVCTKESDMNAKLTQNQNSPMSMVVDSLDQTCLLEVQSDNIAKFHKCCPEDLCLPSCDGGDGSSKVEVKVSQADCCKQDHNYGSILQKWIPVERGDSVALNAGRAEDLSTCHLDRSIADKWNSENIEEEKLSSYDHRLFPLADVEVASVAPCSEDVNSSFLKDVGQTGNSIYHEISIAEESSSTQAASNCHLTHKEGDQNISAFQTELNTISNAVNDAYRFQIASKGVQLATGRPIAEFERFLHSASPVLGQTFSIHHCKNCSGDRLFSDSLCRHQIPNISLGSLWHWYEKPGSYGLEVKAEDYWNSKRLGCDRFEFRAYFVPFLSAVQLFGHSRSSMCIDNDLAKAEVMKTCEVDKPSGNSSHSSLPIFSILLPQPHKEEESSSASGQDEFSNQQVSGACLGDSELLFEYFESEQPQQRRPLFEKIKELVGGNATSNCQIFGDPSKLDCLNLHNLHPASWYSVAWYPIYRIPDGNLRAAFLTYHSLGHFIRENASIDSLGGNTGLAFPVVGLQSYNAQGECWFQPRNSIAIHTKESLYSNSSEILKERLRTLEQTASVMARASVCKEEFNSPNKQPDYEFFLSRRR